jgi:hypothetical protein
LPTAEATGRLETKAIRAALGWLARGRRAGNVSFAKQKFGEGVSTIAMGLGDDFNEELLMALANAGGGAYYYIDSPELMPNILNEELTGLLKLVGHNLTIKVSGPPASAIKQMNASSGKLFTQQEYDYG